MKKIPLIVFLSLIVLLSKGQIVVTQGISPVSGVQNVLLGSGVSITNIQYTGIANSFGTFTTGSTPTSLGLTSGIIMSTGLVSEAAGSAAEQASTDNGGAVPDPQLEDLATDYVRDPAVLEFDFIPLSDTVQFRYVFGSEEYPEFVNSSYNDIFGFFITGSNPSGGMYTNYNIARLPISNLPVTINNVNAGYSSNSDMPTGCTNCQFYVHNLVPGNPNPYIVYDGMTTVLTAVAAVVPCQSYHIKIAIGDVGDYSFDSGVFLEANSFSSPGMNAELHFESDVRENCVVEGCSNADIVFRLPEIYAEDVVIHYYTGGSAVRDVDYTIFPDVDSLVIMAGADTGFIHIAPIQDDLLDVGDTIYIIVPGVGCSSTLDTLKIPIIDNSPIQMTVAEDQLLCDGGMGFLTVSASQGVSPYTYQWSNGSGNVSSVDVLPDVTTMYYVSATDLCNNQTVDSIKVVVGSLMYNISNDTLVCSGTHLALTNSFAGNVSWTGFTGNPINIVANQTHTFQVTMSNVCGLVKDSVVVSVYQMPGMDLGNNTTHCDNETHEFLLTGSFDHVDWYYSTNTSSMGTIIGIGNQLSADESGIYSVVANNGFCFDTSVVLVTFIPCNITAPNIITPNNDGFNDALKFANLEYYSGSKLVVYNRWGRVVYKDDNYQNDWNGDGHGDGIYYYILTLPTEINLTGTEKWVDNISGSITILR